MDDYFDMVPSGSRLHQGIALPGFQSGKLSTSVTEFEFDGGIVLPSVEQSPEICNLSVFKFDDGIAGSCLEQSMEILPPLYYLNSEVEFSDDQDCYPVLWFIDQILTQEQPSNIHDSLALQAAEKSFSEVLDKNYPPSPHGQPSDEIVQRCSHRLPMMPSSQHSDSRCSAGGSPNDSQPFLHCHQREELQQAENCGKSQFEMNTMLYVNPPNGDRQVDSFSNADIMSSVLSESETMLLFKRGLEEGSKFLPTSNQFKVDLKYSIPLTDADNDPMGLVAGGNNSEGGKLANRSRRRSHEYHDDNGLEDVGRSSKQSAVSREPIELSEKLEAVLLYGDGRGSLSCGDDADQLSYKVCKTLEQDESRHRTSIDAGTRAKRREIATKTLDVSTLLTSCSQSIAADDYKAANEQISLIRQHASSTGDAHQRLAFLFANALEARLMGTGAELYTALASKRLGSEELRAFRVYLCAPFKQIYYFFTTKMILEAASKAETLHIVDFGINYGFHWPSLIKQLSDRPGDPPKLRITGIDVPLPGFRPAQRIEETGCRLAKYCERFHVPFEYRAIAISNWENINIEDLNLTRNEVLVVNCQFRFKALLDEAVDYESPRDAVLTLIRRMRPDIFVNDVLNGPLDSPFFITRFRSALNMFSTIMDMLDNILPREDPQRLIFEQEFIGAEVMSVIACEGSARVERAETYKQWHVRYARAGFKPLPLNKDLVKELRIKVKEGYHKDCLFDVDGHWILQGWKGKVTTACSCWVPA